MVDIFLSKTVRLLLHPIVGLFSWNSLPIVDIIFLRCFGKSCFVCIVLPFVDISLIFLLLPALSGLFPQVVLLFFPVSPVPFFPAYISVSLFFIILACFRSFFYLRFQPNFQSWFRLFLRSFLGDPNFLTN